MLYWSQIWYGLGYVIRVSTIKKSMYVTTRRRFEGIDLYRTCTDHNAACKNLGKEPEEE